MAQIRYEFDSTCGFPGEGPVERDLTFATLNVSGIGTLWKHIEDTVFDQHQVLLVQEHRQTGDQLNTARRRAHKRGTPEGVHTNEAGTATGAPQTRQRLAPAVE